MSAPGSPERLAVRVAECDELLQEIIQRAEETDSDLLDALRRLQAQIVLVRQVSDRMNGGKA